MPFQNVFGLLVFGWATGFFFHALWHFAVKAVIPMSFLQWIGGPR